MKALSIKQPWASLVAAGYKTIECRTWKNSYRGTLLICSSKGDVKINDGLVAPGGMALAVVELIDIRRMRKSDVSSAYIADSAVKDVLSGYAWVLQKTMEIIPVPVKGRLNIFEIDVQLVPLPDEYKDHCVYLDAMRKTVHIEHV